MRATFAAVCAALLLVSCGARATAPSATPPKVTLAAVVAAWQEAGLRADPPRASMAAEPFCATTDPGLVESRVVEVAFSRYLYLCRFATPDQAAAARNDRTNNLLNSYRRDTIVLTALKTGPDIQTYLAVFLALR